MRFLAVLLLFVLALLPTDVVAQEMLKKNVLVTRRIGPFVDATDGSTIESGLTPTYADVRLSKNGAAFAAATGSGSITYDSNGFYAVTLATSDVNTAGYLTLSMVVAGARPVTAIYRVADGQTFDNEINGYEYAKDGGRLWFVNNVTDGDGDLGTRAAPLDSISAAISAATAGDTIFIEDGDYSDVLLDKNCNLKGRKGRVSINSTTGPGLTLNSVFSVEIDGLLITSTQATAAALSITDSAQITIRDCEISAVGTGIAVLDNFLDRPGIHIYDSLVSATIIGADVYGSSISLDNVSIKVTVATDGSRIGLRAVNAVAAINNSRIEIYSVRNNSTITMQGIQGFNSGQLKVTNSRIVASNTDAGTNSSTVYAVGSSVSSQNISVSDSSLVAYNTSSANTYSVYNSAGGKITLARTYYSPIPSFLPANVYEEANVGDQMRLVNNAIDSTKVTDNSFSMQAFQTTYWDNVETRVLTGLTAQGYTATRAAKLDRLPASGTVAVTGSAMTLATGSITSSVFAANAFTDTVLSDLAALEIADAVVTSMNLEGYTAARASRLDRLPTTGTVSVVGDAMNLATNAISNTTTAGSFDTEVQTNVVSAMATIGLDTTAVNKLSRLPATGTVATDETVAALFPNNFELMTITGAGGISTDLISVNGSTLIDGYTPKQVLAILGATAAGTISGSSSQLPVIRAMNDSAERVRANTNKFGDRTSVTITTSGL